MTGGSRRRLPRRWGFFVTHLFLTGRSSGGRWAEALRDDDLASPEQAGIQRVRSRAEQHQSDRGGAESEGRDCLPKRAETLSEKIGRGCVEVEGCCRRACQGR